MNKHYTIESVKDGAVRGWRSVEVSKRLKNLRRSFRLLSAQTHKNPSGALAEIAREIDNISIDPNTRYIKVEVRDNAKI